MSAITQSPPSESDSKDLEAFGGDKVPLPTATIALADAADAAGFAIADEDRIIPTQDGIPRRTTKKSEIWAFYSYYIGNSGFGPQLMGASLMQSYMFDAAYDPSILPAVHGGSQWQLGRAHQLGINTASLILFFMSFNYVQAVLPGLSRDHPEIRAAEDEVLNGTLSPHIYKEKLMLVRNAIGDIAYSMNGFGPFLLSMPAVGIAVGMHATDSTALNEHAYNVIMAYLAAVLFVFCMPWLLLEQTRAPQKLPIGAKMWTVGFQNYWRTAKQIFKLKESLKYLVAVILLGESVNTCSTLCFTLQYSVVDYDLKTTLWLGAMSYAIQGIAMYLCYAVQRHWKLETKTMVMIFAGGNLLCVIWGFAGIWWEIWLFNAWFGLGMCPYYQLSVTMIAEVAPAPKIFMFWSFFSLWGKASAFVGPFITSAIIADAGGNTNMGYAFLLPVSIIGMAVLYTVDTSKSAIEVQEFLRVEAELYGTGTGNAVGPDKGDQ
ncbi:hypothetical protein RQP46_001775 [Phenoliferia psychrophenolica]